MIQQKFMCNIVKISKFITILCFVTVSQNFAAENSLTTKNSYKYENYKKRSYKEDATSKKRYKYKNYKQQYVDEHQGGNSDRYENYRKKHYIEKQKSKKTSKPKFQKKENQFQEKSKKTKLQKFYVGVNLTGKYIGYHEETFQTSNGTYKLDGTDVHPTFTYGVGPEIGVNFAKMLQIYARSNIYINAKNENNNTGLRWDSSLETFGIKSELSIIDAYGGMKLRVSLPEIQQYQQKIYIGGGAGVAFYEFRWDYLSNGVTQEALTVDLDSVAYEGFIGYELIDSSNRGIKIELGVPSFEELSGVAYNANLTIGYSHGF